MPLGDETLVTVAPAPAPEPDPDPDPDPVGESLLNKADRQWGVLWLATAAYSSRA